MSTRTVESPPCPTCGRRDRHDDVYYAVCDACGAEEEGDPEWFSHCEDGHTVADLCSVECLNTFMSGWIALRDAENGKPAGGVDH